MYFQFRNVWFVIHELQLKSKEKVKQLFVAVEFSSTSDKEFQVQLLPFGFVTLDWILPDVWTTVPFAWDKKDKPFITIEGKKVYLEIFDSRKNEYKDFQIVLPETTQKLPIVVCTQGETHSAFYAYDFFLSSSFQEQLCQQILSLQSNHLRVDVITTGYKFHSVSKHSSFHPSALQYPRSSYVQGLKQQKQGYMLLEQGTRVYLGEDFVYNLPSECILLSELRKKGQKRNYQQMHQHSETAAVPETVTTTTTFTSSFSSSYTTTAESNNIHVGNNLQDSDHAQNTLMSFKMFPSRTSLMDSNGNTNVSLHTLNYLQQQHISSSSQHISSSSSTQNISSSPSRFLNSSVLKQHHTSPNSTTLSSNSIVCSSTKSSQTFLEVKQMLDDLDWNIQPHDVLVTAGSLLSVDEIDYLVHEITRKAHDNIPEEVWSKERCSYCWNYGHRICCNCFDFSVCDSCFHHLQTSITSSKTYNADTDRYLMDVYCISCFFDKHEIAAQECIQKRIPLHEALG